MDEVTASNDHGNLTNLALKSIIAIGAMGEMSRANGNDSEAQLYGVSHLRRRHDTGSAMLIQRLQRANTLIGEWKPLALSSDQKRVLETFGVEDSWSLTYNLYADLLLGTGLVPQLVSAPSVCATVISYAVSAGVRCSYELPPEPS